MKVNLSKLICFLNNRKCEYDYMQIKNKSCRKSEDPAQNAECDQTVL